MRDSTESEKFVQDLHAWMFSHCGEDRILTLDGYVLTMYLAAKSAIADFIADDGHTMGACFNTKLNFFHSDVLRAAHKAMRVAQFCKSRATGTPQFAQNQDCRREAMNIDEFTVGLWKWRRQMAAHFALCRHDLAKRSSLGQTADGRLGERPGLDLLQAAPAGSEPPPLEGEDALKHLILVKAPAGAAFTTAELREWLRNKRGEYDRKDLGSKLKVATNALIDIGLLRVLEGCDGEAATTERAAKRVRTGSVDAKVRSRRTVVLCKITGAALAGNPGALAERVRLRVPIGSF